MSYPGSKPLYPATRIAEKPRQYWRYPGYPGYLGLRARMRACVFFALSRACDYFPARVYMDNPDSPDTTSAVKALQLSGYSDSKKATRIRERKAQK